MGRTNRRAPYPEWVMMYRNGISAPRIAAAAGVAEATVRRHLAIAAGQDSGLRAAHESAASKPRRVIAPGRRNLADVLAFHEAEGRLPSLRQGREKALATWLQRRRIEAEDGTLSPTYAGALDAIANWREQPTRRDADEARWRQRVGEVAAYLAAGNDWPRHHRTEDQDERILGVWLHTQRIDYRAGKLDQAKEQQLDELIPGWRHGRTRRGANSKKSGT